ncbi:MAG: hypothetical protein N4A74_20585 [Carboxylicivirga sp.]|jgi:hypothetical protein|nr:hypothetical protein [Carboxylicivirga sp.]
MKTLFYIVWIVFLTVLPYLAYEMGYISEVVLIIGGWWMLGFTACMVRYKGRFNEANTYIYMIVWGQMGPVMWLITLFHLIKMFFQMRKRKTQIMF